jgi:hypothetical protein
MRKMFLMLAVLGLFFAGSVIHAEEETVLFSFETGTDGWEIPDWAYEKPDHIQEEINVSDKFAADGQKSLEVLAEFPGGRWTGAIVEIMQYFDWSDYSAIACDIYLPEDAPLGLSAKMILTVGDSWKWVEQSRATALKPGEWTTVTASLKPGSIDWRRVEVDDAFRADVRKFDIRVESNNKPAYSGPFYIDNIRGIK